MLRRLTLTFAVVATFGCYHGSPAAPASSVESDVGSSSTATASTRAANLTEFAGPHKLISQHLPNPVQVHAKVISGGLPQGEAAFQELKDLNIKTIISVDGMRPNVEMARKYGLRYVHLPHGYDGIPEQRAKELAKAVRELEGPIYIHCHHGKHRSPVAASVACVSAGFIPAHQGMQILKIAGTSPNYRGLFASAQTAHPLDIALLEELQVEFPESAPVPPMAEAMVAIGHAYEHLKLIEEAGWKTPPTHPDIVPVHEVLMLREHFTEMLRTEEVRQQPEKFRQWLQESEIAALKLEDDLKKFGADTEQAYPPEALSTRTAQIGQNCMNCHQAYRDVPLNEK